MLADVVDSQRHGGADQLAEDSVAAREVTDRADGLVVHAAGEEPREPRLRLVEDAERRVARARQVARDLQDTLQHLVEVQLGDERPAHVEESQQTDIFQRGNAPTAGGVAIGPLWHLP